MHPLLIATKNIVDFYEDLSSAITSIPNADKNLLLGDFNACVGRDHEAREALGEYGLGKNNNGLWPFFIRKMFLKLLG